MSALARLLVAHAVVLAVGSLIIRWAASPLRLEGGSGFDSLDWSLLVIPALTLGALSGVLEGLLARFGRLRIAAIALLIVSWFAMWPPGIVAGRWPGEAPNTPTDLSDFAAALAGWALFVLFAFVVALPIALVDIKPKVPARDVGPR